MKITKNPNPRQVLVSHHQEPKPYFLFHSLLQSSRISMEEEEEEEEDKRRSTELTIATASSSTECPQEDEVSTALTLGWGVPSSLTTKKRKAVDQNPADPPIKPEREEVLPLNVISEELDHDQDTCIIKKLTVKDAEDLWCRLFVPKYMFENHLMHYWDDEFFQRVLSKEGAKLIVHDCDTRTNHGLTLKYWKNVNSYVFDKKWVRFVKRRDLKKDDEIGLCWDALTSRFMFSVLDRANR